MIPEEMTIDDLLGWANGLGLCTFKKQRGFFGDEIVYCDTGMEFPQMYDHLAKIESYTGREITRLRAEKSFAHYMYDHRRSRGKFSGIRGYGWPRPRARWCTAYLKTKVIDAYFRELEKTHEVVHYVGIAADEQHRAKDKRYPLIEWGITEEQALQYCYERGFDWGGLYQIFGRVSCWLCPLQPLSELRKLRKHFPDLWRYLIEMDDKAWNTFRIGCSVRQLDERFSMEEAQMEIDFGGDYDG